MIDPRGDAHMTRHLTDIAQRPLRFARGERMRSHYSCGALHSSQRGNEVPCGYLLQFFRRSGTARAPTLFESRVDSVDADVYLDAPFETETCEFESRNPAFESSRRETYEASARNTGLLGDNHGYTQSTYRP